MSSLNHLFTGNDLWDADKDCEHSIINASGGGIKCIKCKGWFCY